MGITSDRVFDTPELLEMILLGVPQRDLLTSAQRVCHQWLLHLHTSKPLLRAIGFAPYEDRGSPPPGDRAFNELLVDRFPKFLVHDVPSMARQEPMHGRPERARRHDKACQEALAAGSSAGGTWLSMQIAQPPLRKIAVVDHMCMLSSPRTKALRFRGVCDFPDGMLMGELFFTGMRRVGTQPPPPRDSESPGPPPPADARTEAERHPGRPVGFSLTCKKVDIRGAFLYCDNGAEESDWSWENRDDADVQMTDAAAVLHAQTDAVLVFWMGNVDDTYWAEADWHYFSRRSGEQYPGGDTTA
ncbi:hypothetical protein Micbo1qcDRAFT_177705 [Microdochium bolleyi]|uniref:F-box domain-containing protein n=1 Tax=Microdochium bolleyi TaxID=196109 RepID=A0A136IU96_9PEZI|nr:hypothetical protein Micbo1qcDRAFT_177705 [Microdochium bolleyi]